MENNQIIVKGDIVFSASPSDIITYPNSYLVVTNGVVTAIHSTLPKYADNYTLVDYSKHLIIPAFTDLHVHAPQFQQRGLGMDLELLPWLKKYTFKEEAQFRDLNYAIKVYTNFVNELIQQGTLHACIWSTIHKDATDILFNILSDKRIKSYVGKVNMDQNSSNKLKENTQESIRDTEALIVKYKNHPFVKPIITPRFVPSCSSELLKSLGELAKQHNIPIQSHLAENIDEVKWVKKLYPEISTYSEVYEQFGLLGETPTLMAHCIYLEETDYNRMTEHDTILVHCPEANMNLASGIMPVKKYLKQGIRVGLGTDIGAGHNISMCQVMVRAIQSSKILKSIAPHNESLSFEEVFYMATKGNGSFFDNVGSFENGYLFDALVIDDSTLGTQDISLLERIQRYIYIGDDRNILHRFINGTPL